MFLCFFRRARAAALARPALLAACCGAAVGLAQAQAPASEAPPPAIDLLTAWRRAQAHDAAWQAAQATARAGQEAEAIARAELRPQVALAATRTHNEVRYTGSTDPLQRYYSGTQSLTLRQPLYRPVLRAGLAKAQAEVRDVAARRDLEHNNLLTRVTEAYFDALLAQDQLHMIEGQLANAQVRMDAAAQGVIAGTGTRTDVDEALARRDLLQAQRLEARQAVAWTLQVLQDLVQQPVATLQAVREDAPLQTPLGAEAERSLAQWQEIAQRQSPELQALQAQRDAAEHEIERAQAGHKPTLDMLLQWQRNDRDSVTSPTASYRQGQVLLQLNVPLYNGGGVSAAVRQAIAQRDRAEHALEAARRELGSRVTREWRQVTEGRARIAALAQAVHSARQLVHATEQSQRAGVRSHLDVLEAQERLGTAHTEWARARYQRLVASVRLAVLAGAGDEALVSALNQQLQAAPLHLKSSRP